MFTAAGSEGRPAELLQPTEGGGGGIASLPTHHEPAAYIGSAGETVLLIVSRRRCLGWIETDGRRLVIPRPDKLPRS